MLINMHVQGDMISISIQTAQRTQVHDTLTEFVDALVQIDNDVL